MTFLFFVFVHFMADYPFQGPFLSEMKGKSPILLFTHAGIWTGCIAIAGYIIGYDVGLGDVAALFIVHIAADYLKAANKLWYKRMDALKGGLFTDQMIHVIQILVFMATN
jgi:Protein of unknown function (DUF3307)